MSHGGREKKKIRVLLLMPIRIDYLYSTLHSSTYFPLLANIQGAGTVQTSSLAGLQQADGDEAAVLHSTSQPSDTDTLASCSLTEPDRPHLVRPSAGPRL